MNMYTKITSLQIAEGVEQAIGLTDDRHKLYATVDIGRARIGRTRILDHEFANPKWREHFHLYCADMASKIVFSVKRVRSIGTSVLGRAYLPVDSILEGEEVDTWLDLVDEHGKPIHKGSRIHVKVQYCDVTRDINWDKGLNTPNFRSVPYTFFTQREGCKVFFYFMIGPKRLRKTRTTVPTTIPTLPTLHHPNIITSTDCN